MVSMRFCFKLFFNSIYLKQQTEYYFSAAVMTNATHFQKNPKFKMLSGNDATVAVSNINTHTHTSCGVGDGCILLAALDDGQAGTEFLAPAARTCPV